MLSDREFRILLDHFDRPWSGYRKVRKGVKKRLRRHMNRLGCTTVETYLRTLRKHPEQEAIANQCLLVTISRFFRDRNLWRFMRNSLLPHIGSYFDHPVRFWSAGCACGEEPYSVAVLWASLFGRSAATVLATDARTSCLERAAEGVYSSGSLKEMPEDMRTTYFTPRRGGRQWRIRKDTLPPIRWQRRDLFDAPADGPFHMIFLRNNLLTYHRGARLRSGLAGIVSALVPGGWLVVGSHERLPSSFSNLMRIRSCPWVYRLTEKAAGLDRSVPYPVC